MPSAVLSQPQSTAMQVGDYQSGFLWDPETFDPLVRSPAMAHAMWLMRQLAKYAVPGLECEIPFSSPGLRGGFHHGHCMMAWVSIGMAACIDWLHGCHLVTWIGCMDD